MDDYIDASNSVDDIATPEIESKESQLRKTRGKDIDWEELELFNNPAEPEQ